MPLDGKSVLVTGAGSGIGRALAIEADRRGARLLLCGRQQAPLERTAALLTGEAEIATGDVGAADDRARICDAVRDRLGSLDVLVNNAGIQAVGRLSTQDDDTLDAVLRTNLLAPAALTRDCLPLLRQANGRVVNIGSVFGDIAYPLFAIYSASKFGLRGLSDALRRELAAEGISVTYVAPRAVRTNATVQFANLIRPFGMRLDPPERVAAATWRAVEKGACSAYPRGPERLFVLLQRLFPALIDRGVATQMARPEIAIKAAGPTGNL